MTKPTKPKNYLSNEHLIAELKRSHAQGTPTKELGEAFMLLAKRYCRRPNLKNYSYVDDMAMQATLDLLRGWAKFDLTREPCNPFSYFTTITYHSVVAFLGREKAQSEVKNLLRIDAGVPTQGWGSSEGQQGNLSHDDRVS